MNRLMFAALVLAAPLSGQWLKLQTPGIPRTADGKPDLTAPAPRTAYGKPDLSGYWNRISDRFTNDVAIDLKPGDVQPWAEALFQNRKKELGRDNMETRCLPFGPAAPYHFYREIKIFQTPATIVMLLNDLTNRQIHMDGRELEKDPNPTWMGYSVGHWEGDTLVVESNGFNDKTWLDYLGRPHTEALRLTERYRRRDFGNLDLTVTIDDPGAFTKPFTVESPMNLRVDTEMLELGCENEADRKHMTDVPDAADHKVAAEILAAYSGTYEIKERSGMARIDISAADGTLLWDYKGTGKQKMDAVSDTTFSLFGTTIFFERDAEGRVTHFTVRSVEGDDEAVRKN